MALDLRKFDEKCEIIWGDGNHYHMPLPTQEFLMKVMKLEDIEDVDEQFKFVKEIVSEIMNSNEEGHKFTKKEINELTFNKIQAILEYYMNSVSQSLGE